MDEIVLARQRQKEDLRWRLLKIAHTAGSVGVSETIIFQILNQLALPSDRPFVREQMQYLQGKNLIDIDRNESIWSIRPTVSGIDVVEGTVACPSGIACGF